MFLVFPRARAILGVFSGCRHCLVVRVYCGVHGIVCDVVSVLRNKIALLLLLIQVRSCYFL